MRTRAGALVAATLSLILIFSPAIFVYAEWFGVSPGDFEVANVPPLGRPFALEKKLVIRNGDNIERAFALSVTAPPPENLRENYEAIPDNSWLVCIPGFVAVEDNSSAEVEMFIDMPRWENLLDRRFEAWIEVERVPMPGEFVAPIIVVKAWITTSKELPPPSPSWLPAAIVALVIGISAVALALVAWRYRGKAKGTARKRVIS